MPICYAPGAFGGLPGALKNFRSAGCVTPETMRKVLITSVLHKYMALYEGYVSNWTAHRSDTMYSQCFSTRRSGKLCRTERSQRQCRTSITCFIGMQLNEQITTPIMKCLLSCLLVITMPPICCMNPKRSCMILVCMIITVASVPAPTMACCQAEPLICLWKESVCSKLLSSCSCLPPCNWQS